nr:UvrD-like helicase, ATP-binding domain, P-loop containing nucleoside triphosphate hydrolase [Tanacetum cinerariifolium]
MASRRSYEDQVNKISISIFITNFPDQFYAKDLWRVYNQYEKLIDAFIPNRRTKSENKFNTNVGTRSWFSHLQQASSTFHIDERVTWVDIEGIPLKAWTKNTFIRIASKWGDLLHVDDQNETYFHSKRICIKTTLVENIFESFKIISKGKVFWIRAKKVSGWVPDFVEDEEEDIDSEDGIIEEGPYSENVDGIC